MRQPGSNYFQTCWQDAHSFFCSHVDGWDRRHQGEGERSRNPFFSYKLGVYDPAILLLILHASPLFSCHFPSFNTKHTRYQVTCINHFIQFGTYRSIKSIYWQYICPACGGCPDSRLLTSYVYTYHENASEINGSLSKRGHEKR